MWYRFLPSLTELWSFPLLLFSLSTDIVFYRKLDKLGTYLWLCSSQWERKSWALSTPEQNWKQTPPVPVSCLGNQWFRKEWPREKWSRKTILLNNSRWETSKLKQGEYFWKDCKDTTHPQQTALLSVLLGKVPVTTTKLHFTIYSSPSFHPIDLCHVGTYIWASHIHSFFCLCRAIHDQPQVSTERRDELHAGGAYFFLLTPRGWLERLIQ